MNQEKQRSSKEYIQQESEYGAHNYHPLPVVLERGQGVHLYDVEGKRYFDFLSAYSAVNQGHCHPKIIGALQEQGQSLTLTSRAFHSAALSDFTKYITEYFGFDQVLPMNTGAEAVETAIKICRRYAQVKKGMPETGSQIVVARDNFHGRTTTIISFSSDENAREGFGPFTPGFIEVPYNDFEALEKALRGKAVAGFLIEPIQGEAGVVVPDADYLSRAHALCQELGIAFIADEIQTGIARTGSLLAVCGDCSCQGHCERQAEHYLKPDILILGKALSGGVYPVSAVLADREIMSVITPGSHGSTFGGNPLACAVAMAALEVVRDEALAQKARRLGAIFREEMQAYIEHRQVVRLVRGRGLLNAIVINDSPESDTAWNICLRLAENGLLAKPTHGNIIRFAPPLVMSEAELRECIAIITDTLKEFE